VTEKIIPTIPLLDEILMKIKLCIFLLFLSLFLAACQVFGNNLSDVDQFRGDFDFEQTKRILLISSYHPAFPTFFNQIEGLNSQFNGAPILLDIEFMDSKRFVDEAQKENFYQSLRYKMNRLQPYDAVIAADDNALRFVLDHQTELFHRMPVVFMGINNTDFALDQSDNPWVTGVIEAVSMQETIDVMLKLHPDAREIVALVDGTPTGQGDLVTFYRASQNYQDIKFSELSLTEMEFGQFAAQLNEIPDDVVVLLISAYSDINGEIKQFEESLDLITANLDRPLYHIYYHGLGDGIIGGKVVSHIEQGKTAARMVLRILDGASTSEISVIDQSPNRYVFDYEQLERFNISESQLPQGYLLLNQPFSFYREYMWIFWLVIAVVTSLSSVIIIMSVNIASRRRAESALKQSVAHNTLILDSANEGIIGLDQLGRHTFVNRAASQILGFTEAELIHQTNHYLWHDLGGSAHEKDACEIDLSFIQGRPVINTPDYFKKKNGTIFPVEYSSSPIIEDGQVSGSVVTFRDMTWAYHTTAALRATEEKYLALFGKINEGFALHEIIVDENNKPVDYRFLEVNPAFESLTGLKSSDVVGRRVRDVLPEIGDSWIQVYGQVALSGESVHFEDYLKPLDRYYEVIAYSPRPKYFVTIFADVTERVKTGILLEQQISRLSSLRRMDHAVLAKTALQDIFQVLMQEVSVQLQVDGVGIHYWDEAENRFKLVLQNDGWNKRVGEEVKVISQNLSQRILVDRERVYIPELCLQVDRHFTRLARAGITSFIGVPLVSKGEAIGVLKLFFNEHFSPDQAWWDLLDTFSGQVALIIENISLFRGLQQSNLEIVQAYDTTLQGWANALELRDNETQGHSQRVTSTTVELARRMGIPEAELIHVRRGAQLHDIGKMGIPDHILHKPGPLSPEEWQVMRQHPSYAYRLLAPIHYLRPALDIPYCHHEKWDGSGYPRSLKGAEIPLAARIFAVVDVWDALLSNRPYRSAWSMSKVIRYLKRRAGSDFDPEVVAVFLSYITHYQRDASEMIPSQPLNNIVI
jgi:PAS domain S-box-containing protein